MYLNDDAAWLLFMTSCARSLCEAPRLRRFALTNCRCNDISLIFLCALFGESRHKVFVAKKRTDGSLIDASFWDYSMQQFDVLSVKIAARHPDRLDAVSSRTLTALYGDRA